ncbi:MAG: hypothetical protein ABL949_15135 [Fimbriimonadaceae bacterium]
MRRIVLLVALGSVGYGHSQSLIGGTVGQALTAIKAKQSKIGNPLEPRGFDQIKPRDGSLPAPRPFGDEERVFEILKSGSNKFVKRKVTASGGIHARYKGYDLFGSTLEGDLDTEIFTLTGDVKVLGLDATVSGLKVTVNMKERTFVAEESESTLRPSFLQGRVKDNLYVRGAKTSGSQREVHSHDGGLTSCNLEHPHFEIISESTDVRPERRIILRKVGLNLFGRTVLKLPYLVIPLDRRGERFLPDIGQSQDEGTYVKFKYPIPLRGNSNFLDARFEYMTKLGLGLGANLNYEVRGMSGEVRVWGLMGQNRTFELSNRHRQRFGALEVSISNNIQRQSYLASPENTLINTQVQLSLANRWGQSNLNYYRNSNQGQSFNYLQQTLSFQDSRSWGQSTRTEVNLTYGNNASDFSGGDTVKREQLDVQLRGTHELKQGTIELEYQRSIPIGQVENFFGSPDRTPVLSFRTDAMRLFGSKFLQLPIQANFSVGEYGNPGAATSDRLGRGNIELQVAKNVLAKRWNLDFGGSYRQGIYSDDTAQYSTALSSSIRYTLGSRTSANVRYNYQEPHGFTPFDFDRIGSYNLATMDLSFEPIRNFLVGAQTGYDFRLEQEKQTAWQSLAVRSEWTPAKWFSLRSLSQYDTFNKNWSNVRLDMAYNPGGTRVGIGARYDGFRHTWGNVNLFVDGFKMGRLKVSSLLAYNGYLKQFEARHFAFTYDLHCAEAILQVIDNPIGFRPGTQISFFIRLKALPFDSPFGLGRSGQSYGTGTGYGF